MDERVRGKGLWVGLGCLALLFLCLLLAGAALFVMFAPARVAPGYVQPPAAGEGAVQTPATCDFCPLGILFSGVRALFKVAFLGLLLLLLFGLGRRFFWGPYHWWPHYCTPGPTGKGPEGQPGGAPHHTHWRRHGHPFWGPPPWWGPAPERPADEGEAPDAPDAGEAEAGYSGPQE